MSLNSLLLLYSDTGLRQALHLWRLASNATPEGPKTKPKIHFRLQQKRKLVEVVPLASVF